MRVKRGVTTRAKHNKIRKAAKGFSHPNRGEHQARKASDHS
jgi:ribosomal protein L20